MRIALLSLRRDSGFGNKVATRVRRFIGDVPFVVETLNGLSGENLEIVV